ncbi:MAG: polymorphic toxin-type HINT domain-containing protein [Actinophytocola sp.]|uniref:polymorphic toxin-type HINT domain-containing protein n=1 Tax=Actinophytocola sp. TaxID=1872138 RepID=UPI003C748FF3
MADGTRKPIEDINVGDQVLATEPISGETAAKTVVGTITTQGWKDLVKLTVDTDGAEGDKTGMIVATAAHPFWIPAQGRWLDAAAVHAGESLRGVRGTTVDVLAVGTYQQSQGVHNLTIAGIHTFYVLAGSSPVLVHNEGPFCGKPIGKKASGDSDFHGSGYSLDEMVEFVNGHVDDGNPAMNRPGLSEIENALRNAGPVQREGQNAAEFNYRGVRVIINYDVPWRSTTYYLGG